MNVFPARGNALRTSRDRPDPPAPKPAPLREWRLQPEPCVFRFAGLAVLLIAGTALAAPHKLRVTDPSLTQSIIEQGGSLVADYGAFQIVEADAVPSGNTADARVESVDRFDFIQLSARSLNTRTPQMQSLRHAVGPFTGRHLHLVQFAGPIKPEWRAALEQTGAKIVSYIPQNAYLIYGDAMALAQAQSWAGSEASVQWEGPYQDDYKIHPMARTEDDNGKSRSIGTDTFAIQLVADDEANSATLGKIDRWKLKPVRSEFRILNYHNLIVSLPAERLKDLAAQPDVISIQPYFEPKKMDECQDQIVAGNLSSDLPSGPGYLAWLAGKGFTQAQFGASGFVVDMSDSGIDNGTLKPGHFGLYPLGDTSQSSRVAYVRLEGTANNPGSTLKGCDGHGTLNTHIAAGYDDLDGFPFADSTGYSYGLGVCPFVKVGSSVIFDPDLFTSPNYTMLETEAYASGARVSNNSWGSANGASYDLDAQSYDTLVRDVGASSVQRQMVIVFVAGNGGPSAQSIISPGTAKNVITVGAADNVRSLVPADGGNDRSGSDGCGNTDSDADNANAVVGFSSQGPCSDGRMKPDLVAPGTHVTGGVPQSGSATTNGTGTALSCFLANGDGICGVPGNSTADLFFPLGQEFYTVSTGTSHAAPAVSGACALVRQYFLNANLVAPSPAMTKAFLMNSARYMTGANAGDTLWSPSQGMGELDLGGAFDGVPRLLRDQVDTFTATGQTRTFTGTIADPTQSFRITVAWTDPPGSTAAARALVNDLDLTVTVGGKTYKGNVFSGATSVTGGTADSLNNVESVFLPAGTSGSFTVTITAADIAADALAIGGSTPEQDFALVVYNANPTALPFAPIAASYRGLFYAAGGVKFLQSGAFSLTTTARGGYSGTLQMGAKLYDFSGHLDSSGTGTNLIHRTGTNALTFTFQVDATDYNRITGTITDGSWLAELQAERAPFKAGNSTLLAGKYTVVFPGYTDGGALAPQGNGYGTVTVTKSGQIELSGALSDGAALSKTSPLVGTGDWPLYVSLYGGRGQILGWLTFTNSQSLGGRFSWIKQPIPKAALYPGGFDIETNATGSSFQSPSTFAGPILDFITGRVVLNGGNLAVPITNNVTIASNNKVTDNTLTNKLTVALGTGRGLFTGTVLNPATGRKFGFNGVILQNQGVGLGYFLGTNQSGSVFLGQ